METFFLFLTLGFLLTTSYCELNNRPVIGVFAQNHVRLPLTFIASPYVKFVEMAGGRVVPVQQNMDEKYYENMVKHLNGLLIPGGGRKIMISHFRKSMEFLFKYAMQSNDRGEPFPIWAVCQGFQILSVLFVKYYIHKSSHSDNWLTDCNSTDQATNLNFTMDDPIRQTHLFANASQQIVDILRYENVTINYHTFCITPKNFTKSGLEKYFLPISTSKDINGLTFVSTYESRNLSRPMFALQWHPEKINFEFLKLKNVQENVPHTYDANIMSQYMANTFINEARKSMHKFGTNEAETTLEENKLIIYNFNSNFTGKGGNNKDRAEYFSQTYFFGVENGEMESGETNGGKVEIYVVVIACVVCFFGGLLLYFGIQKYRLLRGSSYKSLEI